MIQTPYLPMIAKWLCIDGVVLWSFSVVVGGSVITREILGGVGGVVNKSLCLVVARSRLIIGFLATSV